MSTNKRQDTQQRVLACLAAELSSIFVALDPFAPSFAVSLASVTNARVVDAWPRARNCFSNAAEVPSMSEVNALQQAWAVATQSDLKLAVLYRSANLSVNPEVIAQLAKLAAISLPKLKDEVAICLIKAQLTGHVISPSLVGHTDLKPGLRLRYGLAHHYAKNPIALTLLQVAATHRNASDYLRSRELGRAVRAIVQAGRPLERLTELEFFLLSNKAVRLAIGSDECRQYLLPLSIQKTLQPELFADLDYDHKPEKIKQLEKLAWALTYLDLESVAEITNGLLLDKATKALAIDLLHVLDRKRNLLAAEQSSHPDSGQQSYSVRSRVGRTGSGKSARHVWTQLAPVAFEWFQILPARFRPPAWWTLSADELAQQIINGSLVRTDVHPAELQLLQRTWQKRDKLAFYQAKRYWALESAVDLPAKVTLSELRSLSTTNKRFEEAIVVRLAKSRDPRPTLDIIKQSGRAVTLEQIKLLAEKAELDWEAWILPAIGSKAWSEKFNYFRWNSPDVLLLGINFLLDDGVALEPAGFKSLMGRCFDELDEDKKTDRVTKLVKRLEATPTLIKTFLSHFSEEILERVLKHRTLTPEVIEFIDEAQTDRILYLKWCLKLKHAPSFKVLRAVLEDRFAEPGLIPWHNAWFGLKGTAPQRALALVLAARRAPKRLVAVAKHFGVSEFEKGLTQAIASMPGTLGRERARLELVLALGVQAAPALAHVLALMKQDAAAGYKLDHAYYRHELPKQSGGTRTISSPEKFLKFIQRQILDRLLTPLGAHDCAYGFLKGRSIADNASPHVNHSIVTNADVKNCFPSVRWSLVLGVMRRDLGKQLSPSAISYLVDICTAEGGMPIGAPTSPALLNRVLLKTDQILLEAATKRHCVYTRYADDLTFSGDKGAIELLGVAKRTLGQIGLALDPKKTNIFRRGRRQMVTGLVVNEQVSIPRRLRRRLRAAVHRVQNGESSHWHGTEQTSSALQGRLAFLQMVHPAEALALKKRLTEDVVQQSSATEGDSEDA